ncbi:hypothetical protein [Amnibacterium kyonggiense]|jgi:uncharacterized membrane protein|uniref:Uncharacterized protein n=1 Tax=Amnibacterium kyonggiense TaxID=595671 RepID=A0A4R7FM60_9MICO|nr:hypothetical protein [Amnibacterium kyonggiense]TDS77476.1 hypothetical protein CLV52_2422 [Amnibacterium kyonggiense]
MGKVLVFLVGLFAGAALAHVASRTPTGARVFAVVNGVADEFAAAVSDSYRARLAEGNS